jgi:trk system potassium uptake protein TrkA
MKFIVIGCGNLGSKLAHSLAQRGHTVTVIDRDASAFERLGSSFKGQTVEGVGFDRDVLTEAGIAHADGLAAVTNSDEANIVTAQLARHVFRVPRVITRLYDIYQADIYRRLGLNTVSPNFWAVNQITDLLCYSQLDIVMHLGNGNIAVVDAEIPLLLVGKRVADLTVQGEISVIAIDRDSRVFLPTLGTTFEAGDRAYIAVMSTSTSRLDDMLHLS